MLIYTVYQRCFFFSQVKITRMPCIRVLVSLYQVVTVIWPSCWVTAFYTLAIAEYYVFMIAAAICIHLYIVHNFQLKKYSIYGKKHPNPNKLQQKVFQRFLIVFDLGNNILKVYPNRRFGKLLFSRWRPRWPPIPKHGHKSLIIHPRDIILVSIPWFWGSENPLRQVRMVFDGLENPKSKMASKMAAIT